MTIKEIASLAGVSISTVSKIVNNKDQDINPETRKRVLRIVKEYNYTPYGTVKNISHAKTFILGVLVSSADIAAQTIYGILQTAQAHGYNIMLLDSQNDASIELKHITTICKNNVDGLIWEPVCEDSLAYERYLSEQNISVTYINISRQVNACHIDFEQMGYDLTQKLLDYKHNKIGCVLKKADVRSNPVLEGFKKCLYNNQINFDNKMVLYYPDETLLNQVINHHFTGLVNSHMDSALFLYEQLRKLHYHIPFDLSLVSLRDSVRESMPYPIISCLEIPYREFGCSVCGNLINLCEKKATTEAPLSFSIENILDTEDSVSIPPSLRSKKILSVGSINIDSTFNVDCFPQAGKTVKISQATTTLGGKGANQAVGAAKLGRDVTLIGKIGNDADSAFILDILNQENISTQGIRRDPGLPTGKAYIYTDNSGESAITIMEGANASLSADCIARSRYLFDNAGYCLLSTELPMDTILEAAKTGRQAGARIVIKPSAQKSLPESLLSLIDLFIPNRKEAATLCPDRASIEEQANYFLEKGIKTVIITLGEEGCYLKTADMDKYFPASSFMAVDTTGGADAFISALVSYLSEGYSLDQAIRIATYAAGFCISHLGVVSSLVDKLTLETYISKTEPELLHLHHDGQEEDQPPTAE